ncbi:INO80 complex subunit B [Cotesia typhae]|uniref:INO80 complex subunit B n=1 Tax=Cotesia typhae TaxID=2053667 RepID=UPI003D685431
MGKPKEAISDIGLNIETISQKRHKKHKHKKHKKKKLIHEAVLGNSLIGRKKMLNRVKKVEIDDSKVVKTLAGTSTSPKSKKKVLKSGKGKDSGTSSEEERWLDAIESGKLEEVDDELKKIKPKDPKLMTARQRAMFERKTDTEPNPGVEQLMSLPTGYKEKVMTAEAIQKAALKSLKRKQMADEKREKDKKKTMERLLKKQESKTKIMSKGKIKRQVPLVTYRITLEGSSISLPPGVDFPLPPTSIKKIPEVIKCGVDDCESPKRYSCSRTGIPLCSLRCYKANIARILA